MTKSYLKGLILVAVAALFLLAHDNSTADDISPADDSGFIVFRDDDIGADWSSDSAIYITEIFRGRNVSHVMAVVPFANGVSLQDDPVIREYIEEIRGDASIEFALHGYDHTPDEFGSVSLEGAAYKIEAGKRMLGDVTGIEPVTFVPPYGVYNDNTVLALKNMQDMNIMSSCPLDIRNGIAFRENDGILYLPGTLFFYNWDENRERTREEIISSCEYSLREYGGCVIILHHHLFFDEHGIINLRRVNMLADIIDWAKLKELEGKAKIVRFKDIGGGDILWTEG